MAPLLEVGCPHQHGGCKQLVGARWSIRWPCWDIDFGASFFFGSGPRPDFFYLMPQVSTRGTFLHDIFLGTRGWSRSWSKETVNLLRFGLVLAKAVQRHREEKRQQPDPGAYSWPRFLAWRWTEVERTWKVCTLRIYEHVTHMEGDGACTGVTRSPPRCGVDPGGIRTAAQGLLRLSCKGLAGPGSYSWPSRGT
jgi:hypothetical protein